MMQLRWWFHVGPNETRAMRYDGRLWTSVKRTIDELMGMATGRG